MLSVFGNDEYEWMPIKAAVTPPQWAINIIKDAIGISTAMQCGLTAVYNSKLLKEAGPLERLSANGGSTRGDQLAVTHWDPSDPWWAEKSNGTQTEEWNKYVFRERPNNWVCMTTFSKKTCVMPLRRTQVCCHSVTNRSPNLTCDGEMCWVNKFPQELRKRNGKNNKKFNLSHFVISNYIKCYAISKNKYMKIVTESPNKRDS